MMTDKELIEELQKNINTQLKQRQIASERLVQEMESNRDLREKMDVLEKTNEKLRGLLQTLYEAYYEIRKLEN